jgi:hypothetical protein
MGVFIVYGAAARFSRRGHEFAGGEPCRNPHSACNYHNECTDSRGWADNAFVERIGRSLKHEQAACISHPNLPLRRLSADRFSTSRLPIG